MKRFCAIAAIAILCLFAFFACAPKAMPTPTPTPPPTPTVAAPTATADVETAARAFVGLLMEGKYAEAYAMFEPQMAAAFPTVKLQATWESVIQQVGALKEIKGVKMADEAGYRIAYVACDFAQTPLDLKVVFGKDGRIAGLWFVPAGSGGT